MAGFEVKKKQLLKPDLQKLIKHLTNFKEDDLEFKQCENFAFSQFLHHTYLSVNRHQVQRSIKGLINKFSVHGFNEKSKRLEAAVDQFVNSERFEDHEEVDVEWGILLFLMNLSDNPTSMVLQEDINMLPCLPPSIEDENNLKELGINWSEYLKEGWEQFKLPEEEAESSLWSELETDKEEEEEEELDITDSISQQFDSSATSQDTNKPLSLDFNLDKKLPSADGYQETKEKDFESDHDNLIKHCEERMMSENWLKQTIQYDWWNDTSVRMEPNSRHSSARFAIIWEEYKNKHTQGLIPLGSTSFVSEYKIIREALWILQAPSNTFYFELSNSGRVFTKENIAIPSLTPESLSAYLTDNVCTYSAMVYHLNQFIDDVKSAEFEMKKPPYTYQAYANVLHKQLHSFFSEVSSVEQKVEKQDTTFTLVSVIEELRPSLNKLNFIYRMHKAATYDWRKCEGWFSTVRLLAFLYDDLYTSWKDEFAEIAMELFIKSFRVYLEIIDIWLSEGKLEDWRDEFILKRYDGELKVVAYAAVLKEIRKTRIMEIFQAVEEAGCDLEHIRKLGEISVLTTEVENKGCLYSEFIGLLGNYLNIFSCRKHSHNQVQFSDLPIEEDTMLNRDELRSVVSEPVSRLQQTLPSQLTLSVSAAEFDGAWYELTTKNLLSSPWLAMSFKMFSELDKQPLTFSERKEEYSTVLDKSLGANIGTIPLHHIIECSLISLFSKRQKIASKIMIDTLLIKFKLLQHLTVLGNVFVLEASYVIQRFYSRLFSPVIPCQIEKAEYSLNVLLEECVEPIIPQDLTDCVHFSIHFTDEQNISSTNIIDNFSIGYKVDLPLSLVITKESLEIYNSVFTFLLKIEWALSSLHQLRFSDIKEKKSDGLRVKLLYKLRMFLMHCVTTLHSYFVAFIPRELRVEMERAIFQASSVEDIINAHNSYLLKLKKHCLLDNGNVIMKAVKKLLVISGDVSTYWTKESQSCLTFEELTVLEEDYTKAHIFLHLVLKHTVGQHSNSSLRLLCADIERCLPVPAVTLTGSGDQSFFEK